jgi:hypothetical protein
MRTSDGGDAVRSRTVESGASCGNVRVPAAGVSVAGQRLDRSRGQMQVITGVHFASKRMPAHPSSGVAAPSRKLLAR